MQPQPIPNEASSASGQDASPVRAVQRAFELLDHLLSEPAPPTLSEVARLSGLPTSTVARLLATLEGSGFVQREGSRYALGPKLIQFGLSALGRLDIYELAEPSLRRLAETTGETANLATHTRDGRATYLRQVLSPRSIHFSSWLGRTLPLDKTAIGRALTGSVDASGCAVNRNGFEPDVTAIAAPIRGVRGEILAALSITGPSYRISNADVIRFGALIAQEARLVSELTGSGIRPLQ